MSPLPAVEESKVMDDCGSKAVDDRGPVTTELLGEGPVLVNDAELTRLSSSVSVSLDVTQLVNAVVASVDPSVDPSVTPLTIALTPVR